jgi:hypothetical protein
MKNKKRDAESSEESSEVQRWAIERLVQETWNHVEHLNNVVKSHPELVIPIARNRIVWPAFISRKRAFRKENEKLMEKIQLGKDFVLTGEWQPDSPSARGAFLVHHWGTARQKQWGLPKLTRRNSRTWFDQAYRCMRQKIGIVMEQDPQFASLGQSAATPAATRAEIKRKIRRSFTQVIRHK